MYTNLERKVQSRQINIAEGNRELSPGKEPGVQTLENLLRVKVGRTKKNLV